jgi:RimJ/RimL family protein N-acetyltransferase
MNLRPLAEDDLETIRILRNRNRHAFFDSREITSDEQRRWFTSLPATPIRFFVIEEAAEVVGTISITTAAQGREVGNLLLEASVRGRGLMRSAVAELTAEPGRYFARVKAGNTHSERVFRAAGFVARPGPAETVFEKIVG